MSENNIVKVDVWARHYNQLKNLLIGELTVEEREWVGKIVGLMETRDIQSNRLITCLEKHCSSLERQCCLVRNENSDLRAYLREVIGVVTEVMSISDSPEVSALRPSLVKFLETARADRNL